MSWLRWQRYCPTEGAVASSFARRLASSPTRRTILVGLLSPEAEAAASPAAGLAVAVKVPVSPGEWWPGVARFCPADSARPASVESNLLSSRTSLPSSLRANIDNIWLFLSLVTAALLAALLIKQGACQQSTMVNEG